MNTIVYKGVTLQLSGKLPHTGELAPDAVFVNTELEEISIHGDKSPIKILLSLPSVDTSTCALEIRTFNEMVANMKNVAVYIIAFDLPFAMKRFCAAEGISNVHPVSDFRYSEFADKYGVKISEGKLKGLHARAVWLLNHENEIIYHQLVTDLSHEPDYTAVLNCISEKAAIHGN